MHRSRTSLPLACMAAYTCGAHTSASALLLHDTRHAGDPPMAKSGICYIDDDAAENAGGSGENSCGNDPAPNADEAKAAIDQLLADTGGDKAVGDPSMGIGRKQAGFSLVELMGALGIWLAGVMGVSAVAPYAKTALAWATSFFS